MDCTSSGHYALEIEAPEMKSEENEVLVNNLSAEYSEKVKQMVKIHKQFAHPVRAAMEQLLKDSGNIDK